ncbi:MAG: UbiX family flavin prenyltransferase [Candidatus Odinarchaeum yellowstonii]|jgi:4-hydroxy-3-polyprenylbenzoate decarboxylase|uniref:Flavin prenyltransferase UbiX n=1 Tax=Odinarchaeota yellowstonii (strain LCB_4) TaxID=1841599 RepID=A0AAF0D3H7_ODILC|nr:MAG: UbiX family flavin prenyltransferase [Candidatus Odinarchaeum yellowstonii]
MKLILAITGASGVIYGIKLLEELKNRNVDVILIISEAGKKVVELETDYSIDKLYALSSEHYSEFDYKAPVLSGSYKIDGMVICPCSMKTASAIANGYSANAISRAAECCLKEGKPLIIVFRETPLSLIHLRNLTQLKEAGVCIMPAAPGFYHKPKSVDDLINFIVGRILDQLSIDNNLYTRWGVKSD